MNRRSAGVRPGMSVVGSSGWYAALGVLSTPPACPSARLGSFWLRARRRDTDVRGECGRFSGNQKIAQGPPVEALTAPTDQLHKTGGGRLRIRQGMVRPAVHNAQFPAEPFKPDRVLQVEELGRKPGGVDVVGVEARADGTTDQSGIKCIGAVLHEHCTLRKAPKPFNHHRYRRCAVQCCGVDAVDTASVRIDPIVAVHERLEAHQMIVHREGNRSQLNEMMRRLPGGLAIEGDKVERFDRRVGLRPFGTPGIDGIVERRKGLGARRTEPW
jgi:hypothetical protein